MEPIGITEDMLLAGFHHGANVARVAQELHGKRLFATGNVAPSPELVALFRGNGSM